MLNNTVRKGRLIVLSASSGTGKTTLLQLLAGALPASGETLVPTP